ncbi:hypothetical protein [Sulfitobacter sp.]|uniref:hypothetical protein n=1 Tax=Sulfitobacter sp. TaxID=1903071 RepID=UPI0035655CF2
MADIRATPMTVVLDQTMTLGPLRISVLAECRVMTGHAKGAVFVSAQKRPVAFLIKQDAKLAAFGPEGRPMSRAEIESLCPGAWQSALTP